MCTSWILNNEDGGGGGEGGGARGGELASGDSD